MMKRLAISVILMMCVVLNCFSQINHDSKKIASKKIHEIYMDNDRYHLIFDSTGYIREMIIGDLSYKKETYKFDINGNWIYYQYSEFSHQNREDIRIKMENKYNDSRELVYQLVCDFDGAQPGETCLSRVDSSFYINQTLNGITTVSEIESNSSCFDNIVTLHTYFEETEQISQINDSTTRIDYYRINYQDTVAKGTKVYVVTPHNKITTTYQYADDSDEIITTYFNCNQVDSNRYRCSISHSNGSVSEVTLMLRERKLFTKAQLYEQLPINRSPDNKYLYYENPLKSFRANKRILGDRSVRIISF